MGRMASIDITRRHNLDPERAHAVMQHIADSLQQRFGVTPRWDGQTLRFARSGVQGFIASGDGQVRVNAQLGLLLAPLKPTVEAEILRKLDQYFPAAE
jgi:putative polyhydroxyalkanoate system protein